MEDYGISSDSWMWSDSIDWTQVKVVSEGYCIDCEKIVDMEYYEYWSGDWMPRMCMECQGRNVYPVTEIVEHLLDRIDQLQQDRQ